MLSLKCGTVVAPGTITSKFDYFTNICIKTKILELCKIKT